jgi:hypothetical protein
MDRTKTRDFFDFNRAKARGLIEPLGWLLSFRDRKTKNGSMTHFVTVTSVFGTFRLYSEMQEVQEILTGLYKTDFVTLTSGNSNKATFKLGQSFDKMPKPTMGQMDQVMAPKDPKVVLNDLKADCINPDDTIDLTIRGRDVKANVLRFVDDLISLWESIKFANEDGVKTVARESVLESVIADLNNCLTRKDYLK